MRDEAWEKLFARMVAREITELAPIANCLLPTFHGGKKADTIFQLNKFLESCQGFLDTAKEADEVPRMCTLIRKKIEGEAYQGIYLANSKTFEEIKKTLIKNYGVKRQFTDFLNDIQECTQEHNESTKEYVDRFEREYKMAINSAETKYQNEEAKKAVRTEIDNVATRTLKYGVKNPALHNQLVTMRTATVEELIEDVERFLREDRVERKSSEGENQTYNINMIQATDTQRLEVVEAKLKTCETKIGKLEDATLDIKRKVENGFRDMEVGLSELSRSKLGMTNIHYNPFAGKPKTDAALVECYICKNTVHFARDCPNKRRGTCYHCGGTEHNFAECSHKKPRENWRSNSATRTASNANDQTNEARKKVHSCGLVQLEMDDVH